MIYGIWVGKLQITAETLLFKPYHTTGDRTQVASAIDNSLNHFSFFSLERENFSLERENISLKRDISR